jgi:hypothetical protein
MQSHLSLEANRLGAITNGARRPIAWRAPRHWLGRQLRKLANTVAPLDSYPRRSPARAASFGAVNPCAAPSGYAIVLA